MESTPQNILITGASSGIGRAAALMLAERGHRLFLHGRSVERTEAIANESGAVGFLTGDLAAPHAAEALLTGAVEKMGSIDCVVHAAGVGLIRPALETTDAEFSRVMNINARVTFLVAREAARIMAAQKRGLFITIPGILGKAVMKNAVAYIASKFAVTGMIKAMAQEFQRQGVRFTLLHLGGVDSPFWDDLAMTVQRDKMISPETAAACILTAIEMPGNLAMNEMTLQPESHQL